MAKQFRPLSKIETVRLIETVQQHPALFDKNSNDYRDRSLVSNIYETIAKNLNIVGVTCKVY